MLLSVIVHADAGPNHTAQLPEEYRHEVRFSWSMDVSDVNNPRSLLKEKLVLPILKEYYRQDKSTSTRIPVDRILLFVNGAPVPYDNEHFRACEFQRAFGAVLGAGVVVAALGEQMLRVTAALADGTLTWCTGPATLAGHTIPTITKAADELGRPTPRVIAALPVCVTSDKAAAAERAAKVFAVYGTLPSYRAMLDKEGAAGPADIAITGTIGEVQDRVAALATIGVTDFAAVEFGATPDEIAQTREAMKGLLR
jgi:alkanesulfonate monooxygenase SsuD/methylene tetrahydromethanopterin reductase-like flavin-dependent oxidoreductase (luciferase family)